MIYTLDEIAQRIRPVAEKYHLQAVYVFGSYARGEAKDDSDVDLLVDTDGENLKTLFALGDSIVIWRMLWRKSSVLLPWILWNSPVE